MIFIIRNNNLNIIRRVLKKTVNLNEDFYRSAAARFIINYNTIQSIIHCIKLPTNSRNLRNHLTVVKS